MYNTIQIDPQAVALIKKAFNFIDQHRGPQERMNERTHGHGPADKPHKGQVEDPEHDRRLSENKDRERKERDKKEEIDEHKRKEEENKKKNKLMQLKQLQQKVNPMKRSASMPNFADYEMNRKPAITPPPQTPTKPRVTTPRDTGYEMARNRSSPNVHTPQEVGTPSNSIGFGKAEPAFKGPGVPPALSSKTLFDKVVEQERQRPGANQLLGTNKPSPEKLELMRQRLKEREQRASTVEDKNKIHIALAEIAVKLSKLGTLNSSK